VHPSIHPSARPSIRQLCMLFLHVPPRPSRDHPAPAARCSSFAVGRRNITCHATPSHPRLSPCAYSSTRGAGASPDPAAILAPRWLRWVALRGKRVCVWPPEYAHAYAHADTRLAYACGAAALRGRSCCSVTLGRV
jgi:hypothetical protein